MNEAANNPQAPSDRTRVRRYNWLARYDRQTVESILDAAPLAHIGCMIDGVPFVTPTFIWREGDRVYWHGSNAGRMFKVLEHQDICLTVSLLDGLVVARSAFNFNCNFRSVMLLGRAELIRDEAVKVEKLKNFVNGLIPGEWDRLRPVLPKEISATAVASLSIEEASCKVRVGPPEDDADDYAHPSWAGIIPIRYQILPPEPDPKNLPGVEMPSDLLKFRVG
ncbi:MAG TPA: pyridoxamine 5'-phosphate oxidase family protein [Candidatus Sulfotelmatobacter sp.]|jgi:nitroimidazol reductase NimA-like FMN-containing flavoprotein (pyridoxamine 5'-phosphate oxidase superfamily)|nr:pyridoxamine 5'-phosphate oxidase family protein [Candidatus Sulfotelmatobacter sp.]